MSSKIDAWQSVASTNNDLVYVEYKEPTEPLHPVVLGDPVHENDENTSVVYPNAPQSLRDLEEDTAFQT